MVDRTGYNDEPTEEELRLLQSDEANAAVPPAEDDDSNPVTPAMAAAEKGLNPDGTPVEPAAAAPAAQPAATPAPAGQSEGDRFKAFLEANKGRTPEELLQLAFQQQQRATGAEARGRQARESLESINGRVAAAAERARVERERIASERTNFTQRLADDPDAATRDVHERMMSADERRIAEEEHTVRHEAAHAMVAQAFPDYSRENLTAFGAEMNYKPEELSRMTDVRDVATLHLASLSGRLIKAGIMDTQGNLVAMPGPVDDTHPALGGGRPAAVTTLSSTPARQPGGGSTVEQQLVNITNMSDKELDAFEKANPGALDALLRQAG